MEPLAHFLDAPGPDAVAATVEMNERGDVYPVVYRRRGGEIEEHVLPPDPLNAFDGPAYRTEVARLVEEA